MITVLGPTASGKTSLAVALAGHLGAEIISGDSRQVYRRMDVGTGKDMAEYTAEGKNIPYHLIDICEPGEKYNVYQYQQDFRKAYESIRSRGKLPVLCGGSGLYMEAALRGYKLLDVPPNPSLRESLQHKSLPELAAILSGYKALHNKTDVDSAQRAIRAIEIEEYYRSQTPGVSDSAPIPSLVIGLQIGREQRRERITARLHARLSQGMVEEVRNLLASGLPPADLMYYGLEYKFLTLYITGKLSYEEMVSQLEIAIHQFAKRQMTWFRGMERRGIPIHWIDAMLPPEEKLSAALDLLHTKNE